MSAPKEPTAQLGTARAELDALSERVAALMVQAIAVDEEEARPQPCPAARHQELVLNPVQRRLYMTVAGFHYGEDGLRGTWACRRCGALVSVDAVLP